MTDTEREKMYLEAYEAHADAILRFCFYKTNNRELAKDLTQETFLKAWTYLSKGGDIREYKAFLYRLAGNLVIDWYRKRKAESLDSMLEDGFDPPAPKKGDLYSELDWALSTLHKLRPEDQELIVWRYVEDRSPGEIASLLQESENTVSVRLHRAVGRLKRFLNPAPSPQDEK